MVESLGAIIPPEVVPAGGALVVPTGALRGVLFCAGAVVCAVTVAVIALSEAISRAFRSLWRIMVYSFVTELAASLGT